MSQQGPSSNPASSHSNWIARPSGADSAALGQSQPDNPAPTDAHQLSSTSPNAQPPRDANELAMRLQNAARQHQPGNVTPGSGNAIAIPMESLVAQAESKMVGSDSNRDLETKRQQLRMLLQQQKADLEARTHAPTLSSAGSTSSSSPTDAVQMARIPSAASLGQRIPSGLPTGPGTGAGPSTGVDQEAITNSLYADPAHLARLAVLGVKVPPEYIPPGLRHTLPPSAQTPAQTSTTVVGPQVDPYTQGNFPPALARPVVAPTVQVNANDIAMARLPSDTSSSLAGPQHSSLLSVREEPPRLDQKLPSVQMQQPGASPMSAKDEMQVMRYLHQPSSTNVLAAGGVGTTGTSGDATVFVETNDGGPFKRMTGWIDPALNAHHMQAKRAQVGSAYETPEQRVARLQQLRFEQLSIMYSESTDTLQRLLSFVNLVIVGFWCGVTFFQVYWGQNRGSHALFIQSYSPIAEPIYVCNIVMAFLTAVLTVWFFYLEIFSNKKQYSLATDWQWQTQINVIVGFASVIALFATASSSDVDALMIHYYDDDPTWYTDPALLQRYSGRLDRWHTVTVVRFATVIITWILCAYKYAYNHTINPDLPNQAQRRGVRSVHLPETVPLSHVAATLHVEDHPKEYARYFPHLLQDLLEQASTGDQTTSLAYGVGLGVDSFGQRRAMVLDDEGKLVQPVPGSDNAHGLRSVFAFV